jgi:hypothetical protein
MSDWQPMETAPKDGRTVKIKVGFPKGVRCYWDSDLERWVLAHPLHMESVHNPLGWMEEWPSKT